MPTTRAGQGQNDWHDEANMSAKLELRATRVSQKTALKTNPVWNMRSAFLALLGLTAIELSACGDKSERSPPAKAENTTTLSPKESGEAPSTIARPKSRNAGLLPTTPSLTPEELLGMTANRMTSLFGKPVFVRRDPPGEFWRYRSKMCALELYFYSDGEGQRVEHKEMRKNDQPVESRQTCINELLSRAR